MLETIASWLPPQERERLIDDVHCVTATHRVNNATLAFDLSGYTRPPYSGQSPYSVEAAAVDEDGADLTIIAYKDKNGRLLELETIRWDGAEVCRPDVSSMRPAVYVGDVRRLPPSGATKRESSEPGKE